jgi:hypothetical protein
MKSLRGLAIIILALFLNACSEPETKSKGEFTFGNLYADSMESGESYFMILPGRMDRGGTGRHCFYLIS